MNPYDVLLDRFLLAHWLFVRTHGGDAGACLYRRWRAFWERRDARENFPHARQ